jgi:hypothetical protein
MTFEELRDFLSPTMRMSHIIQPLLIKSLVDSGEVSTTIQLATNPPYHKESQILCYEK